ncbi:hypothetical protein [Neorhizobium galegae]|uniref:hypothetical protein n=1 Tax=Neorhizobium galegae TaxID=399 RepID=UPI000621DD27|nr:hypothetical protein [Neorhizobium galegae]CDZ51170.1 Hypothetical protein NGAL_HAMBI2427_40220 [Neorhizobium galegae bv. orientalis]
MEIDDLPYEKLKRLLKEDHAEISLNLRIAALFLVVYENLKELITDRVRDFFTNEWRSIDGELVGIPGKEHASLLNGKGVFRACRDFHLEMGAISPDDNQLIDRFIKYRGEVAHELYAILLDDKKAALDLQLLFQAHLLAKKIDRWWILNFEVPLNEDLVDQSIDEEKVASGRQLFLDQLMRVALKDIFELVEEEADGS